LLTYYGTGTILHPTFRLNQDFNLPGNASVEVDLTVQNDLIVEGSARGISGGLIVDDDLTVNDDLLVKDVLTTINTGNASRGIIHERNSAWYYRDPDEGFLFRMSGFMGARRPFAIVQLGEEGMSPADTFIEIDITNKINSSPDYKVEYAHFIDNNGKALPGTGDNTLTSYEITGGGLPGGKIIVRRQGGLGSELRFKGYVYLARTST
jgi:hypothetical protein